MERIIARIREGLSVVRVMRMAGSSGAYLAALVVRELCRPVLLMSAGEAEARQTYEETAFYLTALNATGVCGFLPARQIFSSLPASGDGSRSASLCSMIGASPESPAVISGSVEAFLMRTTPPEIFYDHLVQIGKESVLDRDQLLATLIRSGYTAVSAVMEPGDFSVRGGIIDVFAPGLDCPVRIELWDEQVESLRSFDPGSQKSKSLLDRVLIPPLKEVIVDHKSVECASNHVREVVRAIKEGRLPVSVEADPVKGAGEVLSRLERLDHFPGIESFLPAFYSERASALDYIDKNWVVIYQEPFLCEQAFTKRLAELSEQWTREIVDGGFCLPPDDHFLSGARASELLADCSMVMVGPEPAGGAMPGQEDHEDVSSPKDNDAGQGTRVPLPAKLDPDIDPLPGITTDLSLLQVRPDDEEPLRPFLESIRDFIERGVTIAIVSPLPAKAMHLQELMEGHGIALPVSESPESFLVTGETALITTGPIQRGFLDSSGNLAIIPEAEIFGEKIRPRKSRRVMESFLGDLSDLDEGDFVVHVDHGVGVYRGLKSLFVQWVGEWDFVKERQRPRIRMDCAQIEYAQGSNLYVPVHRINQISKYTGATEVTPRLDTLGGTAWEKLKRKVKRSVREFAEYLIKIYANREVQQSTGFPLPDRLFREFEESFEYEETPDQLRAIDEVIQDMTAQKSMDRVVCGDVGYGKTEVALRAAFLAAMSGRQVAILVPTTILAQQHYETFTKRLESYPIEVRSLSRFLSPKEQKEVIAGLGKGVVDVVIGTHRLLSKDVKFHDLGLLVIDEEHRFGVRHKERLREIRATVDTLTLTATPIPRTLHMALSGLRDLSIIDTPPPDRLSVHTDLVRDDDRIIKEALQRELRRGGQAFFVHNRVQTIDTAANRVRRLAGQARVAVAHGQMRAKELERIMHDFVGRRYDVLVCSAIIESGLDIPSVNTMIVDRSDRFGLAQLYQLRGRIGRSRDRGYCYLMVPAKGVLTKDAAQRLRVLREFTELGSGFRIAAHDLEIRGAGNLLGAEQSGHIYRVGMELYMQLLGDEVKRLKGEEVEAVLEPEIKLSVPTYISEEYMPASNQRLAWYKRFSRARSETEVAGLREELADRYGPLPESVLNLLEVAKIKVALVRLRALELAYTGKEITLVLADDTGVDIGRVIELATRQPKKYRITPENRIFFGFVAKEPQEIFPAITAFLNELKGYDNINP